MNEDDRASSAPESEGPSRGLEGELRRVAHDINGALNTLALNIELLDRATAKGGEGSDGAGDAARQRCLASLRRAVDEIQQIVGRRLVALAGSDPDPTPGAP